MVDDRTYFKSYPDDIFKLENYKNKLFKNGPQILTRNYNF